MATDTNKRIAGALLGTVVDNPATVSGVAHALLAESEGEEFAETSVGQMRVPGATHSIIIVNADQFEIAAARFFRDFINARYCQAANIRSTENEALCQLFEELFRRTRNALTLFLEDLERGRLDTDYELTDELRVVGRPIFDCVLTELSQILPPAHQAHLTYLSKLREEMRVGFAQTMSILIKRATQSTPLVGKTFSHATITVLWQLFELEKSYCHQTNLPFQPTDEGHFLSDVTA